MNFSWSYLPRPNNRHTLPESVGWQCADVPVRLRTLPGSWHRTSIIDARESANVRLVDIRRGEAFVLDTVTSSHHPWRCRVSPSKNSSPQVTAALTMATPSRKRKAVGGGSEPSKRPRSVRFSNEPVRVIASTPLFHDDMSEQERDRLRSSIWYSVGPPRMRSRSRTIRPTHPLRSAMTSKPFSKTEYIRSGCSRA